MSINHKPTLLLLVTQSDLGGAQRYVLSLAQAAREHFRVIVAAGADGGGWLLQKASSEGLETFVLASLGRAIHPWRDARAILECRRLLRNVKPDIVHANSTKAGVLVSLAAAGWKQRPQIVYTAHGWIFLEPLPTWMRFVYRWIERLASNTRDAIIVLSQKEKEKAIRGRVASSDKLFLIPNGVSLRAHDRERARMVLTRAGVPRGATLLGCVANFYPVKNLPSLVRAFRNITNKSSHLHLVLIGDGNERSAIEEARQGDPHIHLLGYRPDVRELLDGCDLFVLPSLKEGFPFALLEAMEASLPCLATDVGGIPEIIKDDVNGWLAKPNDLERGLRRAISSRDRWPQMGRAARESVLTSFTEEKMTSRTIALYKKLLLSR